MTQGGARKKVIQCLYGHDNDIVQCHDNDNDNVHDTTTYNKIEAAFTIISIVESSDRCQKQA